MSNPYESPADTDDDSVESTPLDRPLLGQTIWRLGGWLGALCLGAAAALAAFGIVRQLLRLAA